jgi:Tol biopolymer transport system component
MVNSLSLEFSPEISADGLALFFSSNRPGMSGLSDLYLATRPTVNEPWGAAINLGPNINTPAFDEYPEISSDGRYLMFMSTRPGGMGGFDLWQVEINTIRTDSLQKDNNAN